MRRILFTAVGMCGVMAKYASGSGNQADVACHVYDTFIAPHANVLSPLQEANLHGKRRGHFS